MINPAFALELTAESLDPRVTFSRALNTATRINSAGLLENVNADTARFDYDPISLACRGLLIEETRVNGFTYSEAFNDASWVAGNLVKSASVVTDPRGNTNAIRFTATAGLAVKFVAKTYTASAGTTQSVSFLVRAGTHSFIQIYNNGDAQAFCNFDLTSGVVGTAGTKTTGAIKALKNGWYICTATFGTTTTYGTGWRVYFAPSASATYGQSLNAVGTESVDFFFGQIEAGAFPTSLITTTTTAMTRNADIATITGANFSDWWQAGKGSALVRARPSVVSGTRPLIQFDDTTGGNIIALRGNATNPELYVRTGGSDQVQIDAGTIAANTSYRLAGSWAENSCAASINSGTPVLDGVATIPVVTQSRLGSDGTNYLNGHLEAVEYYDERVLDASLQVVSSTAGYRSIIGPVFRDAIIS
jgi:hypothetical protein